MQLVIPSRELCKPQPLAQIGYIVEGKVKLYCLDIKKGQSSTENSDKFNSEPHFIPRKKRHEKEGLRSPLLLYSFESLLKGIVEHFLT